MASKNQNKVLPHRNTQTLNGVVFWERRFGLSYVLVYGIIQSSWKNYDHGYMGMVMVKASPFDGCRPPPIAGRKKRGTWPVVLTRSPKPRTKEKSQV